MRSNLRRKWESLYLFVEKKYRGFIYREKAKIRLKKINGGCNCKEEYKKIVIPFWGKYGIKPDIIWWKLLCKKPECLDPRYIPDDIWFERILPYYSNMSFRRFGEDKCYHGIWLKDAKRPFTIVANVAGVFYDDKYNIITKEEAIERCISFKKFLIKPSIDSGEGRLIKFFEPENVNINALKSVFEEYKCNFLIQEIIEQSDKLSKLNASSLNTLRIVTFLFKNQVHVLSSIMRMGANGSRLDNIGAGGFACAVDSEGRLSKYAVNRQSEWCEHNNNGVYFSDVIVPSYQNAVKLVKSLHSRLAHFKIIGWDIGIDKNDEPILIEFNTNPGQNQYSCGPTFGDLTEDVLSDVFITKELEKSNN